MRRGAIIRRWEAISDPAYMKTIILAGGQGTRLSEETEIRPKPMVDIWHRPILWHILKIYVHYGFGDFLIAFSTVMFVAREAYSAKYRLLYSPL